MDRFGERILDSEKMFLRVCRLHNSLLSFFGCDLDQTLTELFVVLDRVDDDAITFRCFGMSETRVVLLVDWVMYQPGGHIRSGYHTP